MSYIDSSKEGGKLALEQLEHEQVIWLTTVRADGQPQTSAVWFLWTGREFVIYSMPDKPKLRNIQHNPRVSLNFNTDPHGMHVVAIEGTASIDEGYPSAVDMPAIIEKYREGIARIGTTPEEFSATYRVPVIVTPRKFRYF
ncbi:MAG TPA: TIGR03667 family PPOX class F420-dependent oxidoreductase [Thermomicrobiaceae bacterium]|nr:TIGR03667 family PPOX class F420-dependent oxidoreductase [Thermomicrobiaceae bacterium]